jgi:hypothetical protein
VVDPTAPGKAPEVAGDVLLDSADLVVIALPETTPRERPAGWLVAMALAWGAFLGLLGWGLVSSLWRNRPGEPRVQTPGAGRDTPGTEVTGH